MSRRGCNDVLLSSLAFQHTKHAPKQNSPVARTSFARKRRAPSSKGAARDAVGGAERRLCVRSAAACMAGAFGGGVGGRLQSCVGDVQFFYECACYSSCELCSHVKERENQRKELSVSGRGRLERA